MRHPFDLEPADLEALDLDFEEQLTEEEAARVGGGKHAPIVCISAPCPGSEGGGDDTDEPYYPYYPLPFPKPKPIPIDPPDATTLAIGEEGGGPIYTKAFWENG